MKKVIQFVSNLTSKGGTNMANIMKPMPVLNEWGNLIAFELVPGTPAKVFPFSVKDADCSKLMFVAPLDLINLNLINSAIYEQVIHWGIRVASVNRVCFGYCKEDQRDALCFYDCIPKVLLDGENGSSINAKGAKNLLLSLQAAVENFDKMMSLPLLRFYEKRTIFRSD